MRVHNVFSRVCLFVQAIVFEPLHIGTSFLVWRYILTISRSSLSIKVIGSRSCKKKNKIVRSSLSIKVIGSRSCKKKKEQDFFNLLFLCMWLQVINKVKVTHQGHFKGEMLLGGWFAFESNAFLSILSSS